jgi:hypothetical protein
MQTDEVLINGVPVRRRGASNKSTNIHDNLPEFITSRGWDKEYDEDGTLLVSKFTIDTEVQIYLVITVMNWHEATGERGDPEWNITLRAVSPESVTDEAKTSALESSGIDLSEAPNDEERTLWLIEALTDYGTTAPIADFYSDDANVAVLAARQEAVLVQSLLGFYMDRPVNKIGSTGWQFIRGAL